MPIFHGSSDISVSLSCLDVISLIYGFLRRWRICCHLAHLSWFNRRFYFSFLFGCNLSDLWIPEVVEDMLSSFPSFMVQQTFSISFSCLDVISLIYGFLRRWRICCHLAHLSWFKRHFLFLLVWIIVKHLIFGFLRGWRICCHLAHILWFIIKRPYVFLLPITT
jgi:hypothetical protein